MNLMKKFYLKDIPTLSFLVALNFILTRIFTIQIPFLQLSFGFIPISITSILYPPFISSLTTGLADIVGAILKPSGPFHLGFTFSSFLTGFVYSFFLYKKPRNLKNIILATLIVKIFINIILNSFWLYTISGVGSLVYIPIRILKNLLSLIIEIPIIYINYKYLIEPINKYFL